MRLSICFIFSTLLLIAQSQSPLMESTKRLAMSDAVKNGRLSFYAKNLTSSEVLVDFNSGKMMTPASTMKVLTTYAALDLLGAGHRFTTKIAYTGMINEKGVLDGNILVIAGGDPSFASSRFMKNYGDGTPITDQIAGALMDLGISELKGDILFDEQIYSGIDVPDHWTWQDMGNYYAAGAHAFTYKENTFKAYFKSGSTSGQGVKLVRSENLDRNLTVVNQIVAENIRSDQAYFYSSPHSDQIRMHGAIPLNQRDFEVKGAMPNPKKVFIQDLNKSLARKGISTAATGDTESSSHLLNQGHTELIVFESAPLRDIVAYTNLKSNNLFAEHLLRQLGVQNQKEGSFEKGLETLKNWSAKNSSSMNGFRASDGSGLSRSNVLSSKFLVEQLESLSVKSYFESFKKGLPVAGMSGSMRRVGKGTVIEGKMYAKTGYIDGVRAYCGYVQRGEELIAFSIIANDYSLSASQMRVKLTELMVQLGK